MDMFSIYFGIYFEKLTLKVNDKPINAAEWLHVGLHGVWNAVFFSVPKGKFLLPHIKKTQKTAFYEWGLVWRKVKFKTCFIAAQKKKIDCQQLHSRKYPNKLSEACIGHTAERKYREDERES